MSTRTDYSPREWNLLKDLPYLVAAAIISTSLSGGYGKMREAFSIMPAVRRTARQFPDNTLIQELREVKSDKSWQSDGVVENLGRERIGPFVLEKCREALSVLEEKSTPDEIEQYKLWLLLVAKYVANAAKSGGFLGLGSLFVDKGEAQWIQQLTSTLGIEQAS
jgi:hypothetical protein